MTENRVATDVVVNTVKQKREAFLKRRIQASEMSPDEIALWMHTDPMHRPTRSVWEAWKGFVNFSLPITKEGYVHAWCPLHDPQPGETFTCYLNFGSNFIKCLGSPCCHAKRWSTFSDVAMAGLKRVHDHHIALVVNAQADKIRGNAKG